MAAELSTQVVRGHPPTGVVALCFCDVEDSTPFAERVPAIYPGAIATLQGILADCWRRFGGFLVSAQGEECFVAFSDSATAIRATVEAQRSLAAHSWPEGMALRVRIGIHTGEPLSSGDGYVGLDVHRAARVTAAAYGGQVLVAASTREAAGVVDGVEFMDLGSFRFKGLSAPERLFQLIAPGLAQSFPAPINVLNPHASLPAQATRLVGREGELRALGELLGRRDIRLVTLTGTGGTGKTRLAIAGANQESLRFTDGVCFVPLAADREAAQVPVSIAHALDIAEAKTVPDLVARIRELKVLLILDNCEQVLDAGPMVAEILAGCPGVKVLATSRVPFHLTMEREFPVAPLGLPNDGVSGAANVARSSAVQLFVERAAEVRPSFTLTEANARAVAAICNRLDGLPLAIELVAARSKLLSPEHLLSRIESGLDAVANGKADIPERHRSLRAAISWSYDLLPEDEQLLFRHLAVFTGRFTFEAAEAIVPEALRGPRLLDRVEALVTKSLLRLVGEGEETAEPLFSMLETIRQFGAEALEAAGEMTATRDRHLAWMRSWMVRSLATRSQQDHAVSLLHSAHEIRNALTWAKSNPERATHGLAVAAAAGLYWWQRSPLEGIARLSSFLGMAQAPSPALRSRALYWMAFLSSSTEPPAVVVDLARQSLSEARRATGLPTPPLALALNMLAESLLYVDALEQASALSAEAVATARAIGDPVLVAVTLGPNGIVAFARADFTAARNAWEESRDLFMAAGDTMMLASPLCWLATLDLREGRVAEAEERLARCADLLRRHAEIPRLTEALPLLAGIRLSAGDDAAARAFLRDAIAAARLTDVRTEVAPSLAGAARVAAVGEDWTSVFLLCEATRRLARARETTFMDWTALRQLQADAERHLAAPSLAAATRRAAAMTRESALDFADEVLR